MLPVCGIFSLHGEDQATFPCHGFYHFSVIFYYSGKCPQFQTESENRHGSGRFGTEYFPFSAINGRFGHAVVPVYPGQTTQPPS
jgi:hypothetical protein